MSLSAGTSSIPAYRLFSHLLAQHMDHGIHRIPVPISFRLWVPRCKDYMALGLRNRVSIRCGRLGLDRLVHERNVGFLCDFGVALVDFGSNRMYDRTVKPIPEAQTTGLRYRIESLIGITGVKMAKYRISWTESILSPLNVVWRPHLLGILIFEVILSPFGVAFSQHWEQGVLFGFGIGINVRFVLDGFFTYVVAHSS